VVTRGGQAETTGTDSLWLRRFHRGADTSSLVCFPHAGGSAGFYFGLSRALSELTDVVAVQYPGRQDRRREPPLATVDQLADELAGLLVPFAGRPLRLFGHSMGATVAFEVARRLQAAGREPAGLFVSGRRAPSTHRDERVHLLSDEDLLAEVHALNGTGSAVLDDEELLRLVLPVIRADYRAIESYRFRAGPPLRCPVFAFTGDRDPKAAVDEVLAWRRHTTGRFTSDIFSGGHFFLNEHMPAIINTITAELGR
jgi:pyochelin biosynthetic protein PchC